MGRTDWSTSKVAFFYVFPSCGFFAKTAQWSALLFQRLHVEDHGVDPKLN